MRKQLRVILATAAMTLLTAFSAFAGTWHQDNVGWWYENDDGSYLQGGFAQVDGVWYYFDGSGYMQTGWVKGKDGNWYYMHDVDGYMLTSTMTPDGYWVDENGVWDGEDADGQSVNVGELEANTMIAAVNGEVKKFYLSEASSKDGMVTFKYYDESEDRGDNDMKILIWFRDEDHLQSGYYEYEEDDDFLQDLDFDLNQIITTGDWLYEYDLKNSSTGEEGTYCFELEGSGNTWSGRFDAILVNQVVNRSGVLKNTGNPEVELTNVIFNFTFDEEHPYSVKMDKERSELGKKVARAVAGDEAEWGYGSAGNSYSGSSSGSGSSSSRACTFCRGNGLCHACDGKGYGYTSMFGMSYYKCSICYGRMICTHCSGTGRK